ncbi:hypothetical protein KKF61_08675 [Patescibacteria group bacterium]|nr:hypothetical protein [Patescibacteria group bacterium]
MQANVTSPGPQGIVLRGYITERRPDGLYAAPLLPQLFFGADGTQLTSWRQYISGTGAQTILSRSGGQPSIPKEELYWRRVGNAVRAPVGVYSVGQKMPGSLQPLSPVTLSTEETEKGKYYELHIDTDGIPDPRKAVETLIAGLRAQGVETVWASADAKSIRLQIAGSPMSWPVVLSLLPSILGVLGIAVILISVYLVTAAVPSWVWGLLIVGILLITILPKPGTRMR